MASFQMDAQHFTLIIFDIKQNWDYLHRLPFSIKWLHGHNMQAFSHVGPTHATSKVVAHGTCLSSRVMQGVSCRCTFVTMTIWVNSLHKSRRSSVAWLLEFLFTHAILSTATTPKYLGCRIQHFMPNFYHHRNICQFQLLAYILATIV